MIDMETSHSAAYAAAGVDITAGYKGVKLMSADVKRTHIPGVVSDIVSKLQKEGLLITKRNHFELLTR